MKAHANKPKSTQSQAHMQEVHQPRTPIATQPRTHKHTFGRGFLLLLLPSLSSAFASAFVFAFVAAGLVGQLRGIFWVG